MTGRRPRPALLTPAGWLALGFFALVAAIVCLALYAGHYAADALFPPI